MATHDRTQLGAHPFNHNQSQAAEEEYDRLRNLARQEHAKMQSCFDRAHQAYGSGDGAEAHSLSQAGKQHQAQANAYNKQASEFIFRENNTVGRVDGDTIDLHGLFVDEAREVLKTRVYAAIQEHQDHLHVIVGKGNHSPHHIQHIKPAAEQLCQELGISYHTEPNEGRMYLDLRGASGSATYPQQQQGYPYPQQGYAQHEYPVNQPQQHPQQGYFSNQEQQQQQQMNYPGQQLRPPQQQFQTGEQQGQQDPLTSCIKSCCTVM